MTKHARSIDVSLLPALRKLVEDVRASNEPCVLSLEGEEIALILPVKSRDKRRARWRSGSAAGFEAFRSAAGGWSDVDTDRLLADIYADRERGDRPPVDL